MVKSFLSVEGHCLVLSFSFFFQGKEFTRFLRGRGRGLEEEMDALTVLVMSLTPEITALLGRLLRNIVANHRTHYRSFRLRRGLFRCVSCSQVSWLETHWLEQCLNQVVGQLWQRTCGYHHWRHLAVGRNHAGCWVSEIPSWQPESQVGACATILARKWLLPDTYF